LNEGAPDQDFCRRREHLMHSLTDLPSVPAHSPWVNVRTDKLPYRSRQHANCSLAAKQMRYRDPCDFSGFPP